MQSIFPYIFDSLNKIITQCFVPKLIIQLQTTKRMNRVIMIRHRLY